VSCRGDTKHDSPPVVQLYWLTRARWRWQVEARTRKEVDEKREELRQLVGGSYRDLIDSADSIVAMAATTQQVAANTNLGVATRLVFGRAFRVALRYSSTPYRSTPPS
jgi:hypothetical protein